MDPDSKSLPAARRLPVDPTVVDGKAPSSNRRSNRGFASMDPERRRLIAAQGGRAAHASGHAHQFNSEEARDAGRKGGRISGARRAQGHDPAPRGND